MVRLLLASAAAFAVLLLAGLGLVVAAAVPHRPAHHGITIAADTPQPPAAAPVPAIAAAAPAVEAGAEGAIADFAAQLEGQPARDRARGGNQGQGNGGCFTGPNGRRTCPQPFGGRFR